MSRKNNQETPTRATLDNAEKSNAQQAEISCIISPGPKCPPYRKIDLMSRRYYTIGFHGVCPSGIQRLSKDGLPVAHFLNTVSAFFPRSVKSVA